MNYFPFHIGDYAVHTRHLSLMEDLAYRRCLDLYYTRELALPADPAQVARLIGMREHVSDVESVLKEFFVEDDKGDWVHSRCEGEIKKAREAAERARTNGKAGGRPPGTKQEPKGNPEITQPVPTGAPDKSKSKAPITQDQSQSQDQNHGKEKPPAAPWLTTEALMADGLSEEVAGAWLAHRRAKKAKLTALAWQGFKAEAEKAAWGLEAAVLKAISRHWTSFEAAWVVEQSRSGAPATPGQRASTTAGAARLLGFNSEDTIDG